jgi:hypothetical protein
MVGWAFAPAQGNDAESEHRSHLYLSGYKHLFRGSDTVGEEIQDLDEKA